MDIRNPKLAANRAFAIAKLYAFAKAEKRWCFATPDKVVVGIDPSIDGVAMVCELQTALETVIVLPPLAAVAIGQQLVRRGGQMLERMEPAIDRHTASLGSVDAIRIDRIHDGPWLDS